jgi:tRNA G18 (ribose-2'-O)-methylase SpoU
LGTDSQGDISLNNHALKRPLALVMGNEAKGISRNIQEMVDGVVSIPLKGQVNSLNLACATTVLLYLVE